MNLIDAIRLTSPTAQRLSEFVPLLEKYMSKYDINTPARQAMFIAQCLHESGGFKYTKEIWGPTKWQMKYDTNPKLGNTVAGDGKKFMGRGLIQLTGRANYQKFSEWINAPFIMDTPDVVAAESYAVLSAIFFWNTNNLNRYADVNDIVGCTKEVNGSAMLGLEERTTYYKSLLKCLSGGIADADPIVMSAISPTIPKEGMIVPNLGMIEPLFVEIKKPSMFSSIKSMFSKK